MRVPELRHLFPRLGEDVGELFLAGLPNEPGEVVLQEHDAHDILQHLRVRIGFHALLANERANAPDVTGLVPGRRHDFTHTSGVKLLEMISPAQIADAAVRVTLARRGPALDMLSARSDAKGLGC